MYTNGFMITSKSKPISGQNPARKNLLKIFFCGIWWFFKVYTAKYAEELGKIIKYSKNLEEIMKTLQFLQCKILFKFPLLEQKMLIVMWSTVLVVVCSCWISSALEILFNPYRWKEKAFQMISSVSITLYGTTV